MWWLGDLLGGYAGPVVVFLVLAALSAYMFLRSQRQPVHPGNVNDEWTGTPTGSVLPQQEVNA
jgi:PiT family inorganic phosphate transporter